MACTCGKNQHERAHGIEITGNFRATSERTPRYSHKSSCMLSCSSKSSQCPENKARSMRANRPEKSIQNEPKIVPGRCLGDIRGLPGASRKPVRADFQTQLKIYEKHEGFWEAPGRLGRPLGTQRDPKDRLKIDSLVEKRVPNVDSLSIFVHKAVVRGFSTIWYRFFTKNRRKIKEKLHLLFHTGACFLEHGDPHETSSFTIRKLLLVFFVF